MPSPPLPQGHGELVLVVDDEEAIRAVAKRMLEQFGYRTLLATHGAEAVALYAQHRADIAVVLTDMAMPVMDGPSLVVALKSIDPGVRIIGTSGLMVVAKSEHAYGVLKAAFKDRTVEKIYHAVVQGHPDPLAGTIDAPIGPASPVLNAWNTARC